MLPSPSTGCHATEKMRLEWPVPAFAGGAYDDARSIYSLGALAAAVDASGADGNAALKATRAASIATPAAARAVVARVRSVLAKRDEALAALDEIVKGLGLLHAAQAEDEAENLRVRAVAEDRLREIQRLERRIAQTALIE